MDSRGSSSICDVELC